MNATWITSPIPAPDIPEHSNYTPHVTNIQGGDASRTPPHGVWPAAEQWCNASQWLALRVLFLRHGSGVAGWQVAVDGCSGDSKCFGDLGGAFPVGSSGLGGGEGIGAHDGWASAGAALGAGGCQACHGPFADHVAFEFGERGHHDEEELPFSGRVVGSGQGSGENAQADSLGVEVVGDGEDFFH